MKYIIPLKEITLGQIEELHSQGYSLKFHYNKIKYDLSYVIVSKEA